MLSANAGIRRGQEDTEQVYAASPAPSDHRVKDSQGLQSPQAEAVGRAPLLLVGLLALAAVWWDGAFDLRYWAPLALLALASCSASDPRRRLALPGRGPLAVAVVASWAFVATRSLGRLGRKPRPTPGKGRHAATSTPGSSRSPSSHRRGWGRRWVAARLVLGVVGDRLRHRAVAAGGRRRRLLWPAASTHPIGYRNGTAALFAFAVWPLVGAAARRGFASGLRARRSRRPCSCSASPSSPSREGCSSVLRRAAPSRS